MTQPIHTFPSASPSEYLLASIAAETVQAVITLRANSPDNRFGGTVRGGDDRRAAPIEWTAPRGTELIAGPRRYRERCDARHISAVGRNGSAEWCWTARSGVVGGQVYPFDSAGLRWLVGTSTKGDDHVAIT